MKDAVACAPEFVRPNAIIGDPPRTRPRRKGHEVLSVSIGPGQIPEADFKNLGDFTVVFTPFGWTLDPCEKGMNHEAGGPSFERWKFFQNMNGFPGQSHLLAALPDGGFQEVSVLLLVFAARKGELAAVNAPGRPSHHDEPYIAVLTSVDWNEGSGLNRFSLEFLFHGIPLSPGAPVSPSIMGSFPGLDKGGADVSPREPESPPYRAPEFAYAWARPSFFSLA